LKLGTFYDTGTGVTNDVAVAAQWYKKAAAQGVPEAEYALAICYADGAGVPQDLVEACKWITLASAHGLKEAAIFKVALEKKLTPDQKTRAQQLANAALNPHPPN
jgi:TPR repeat protein